MAKARAAKKKTKTKTKKSTAKQAKQAKARKPRAKKAKAKKRKANRPTATTRSGPAPSAAPAPEAGSWGATCEVEGVLVESVSEREAVDVALEHLRENPQHDVSVVPPEPGLESLGSNRWDAKCFTCPLDLAIGKSSGAAIKAANAHAKTFPTHEIDVWEQA
jgi:hypothetical protein